MRYRRIILKLSGEALRGPFEPMNSEKFDDVCRTVEALVALGVEVCVVAGGGNIIRGDRYKQYNITRAQADQAGMIATGQNAQMLVSKLTQRGASKPTILTNGPCLGLGPMWSPERAIAALDSGQTPVVAGGSGQFYVSTDYPAVTFAEQVGAAAVLMAKSGTDGVYARDPKVDPTARFLPSLTMQQALDSDLHVMDREALEFSRKHGVYIHVFSAEDPDLPARIIKNEQVGSILIP